jgi:two-component system CitB family sensor kinase
MVSQPRRWSISARLFALQVAFILLIGAVAVAALALDTRARVDAEAATRSTLVATSIAKNPFVIDAVQDADPSVVLQPYAVDLIDALGVDFATIMTTDGIRLTHRDPDEIGKPFIGTTAPALEGETFTETFTGTLGPSVRAVAPIRADDGEIVALVSVGITVENLAGAFGQRIPAVIVFVAALIIVGALASWLLSRYLRRVTWGRGPEEMGRMFAYYESVLHSVREGLVLVDNDGRIVLYNDQAAELLSLPLGASNADAAPQRASDYGIPAPLADLLASGRTAVDEIYVTDDRVLVLNQQPAVPHDEPPRSFGTVTTLRDRTEMQQLTGELASTKTMADALRSQTHEFSNRLHTIVSLIELGRATEALELASAENAISQELADRVLGSIDEPVLAALLLGKSAQARERGVNLLVDVPAALGRVDLDASLLVTILGNLLDNAMDAAASTESDGEPWVEVYLALDEGRFVIQVSDSGSGIAPDEVDRAFTRGYSTKEPGEHGRGLGLALVNQAVRRLGGTIEVGAGSVFTVELPRSEAIR